MLNSSNESKTLMDRSAGTSCYHTTFFCTCSVAFEAFAAMLILSVRRFVLANKRRALQVVTTSTLVKGR
jgi:hypothetical protein